MTTVYYVEVPNTFPRTYERVEVPPARGDRFVALDTEVVVHSKMHGSHEKPQPYALRGVAKHGRLLVQTLVGTEYDPVGRWHEIDGEYTVEGYRFKRYALKPLLTILKLATNAAKVRGRQAAKQAKLDVRDEKVGCCPCCFGDYVVHRTDVAETRDGVVVTSEKRAMVHHGYERPGIGYIVGDCHGVRFPPYEISCEGTRSWLKQLGIMLQMREHALGTLDTRDEILVDIKVRRGFGGKNEIARKTIKRGEEGFDRAIAERRRELTYQIDKIGRDIVMYTEKVHAWRPRPWPRVQKKGAAS